MASETHESVVFIYFHIIDSTIDAIYSFKYKWNTLQVRISGCAFEDFSLDYREITSFNGQHQIVIDYYILDVFYPDQGLLSLTCRECWSIRYQLVAALYLMRISILTVHLHFSA